MRDSEQSKQPMCFNKKFPTLTIHILPILKDNYVFILEGTSTKKAVVIDPGDGPSVNHFLESQKLQLSAIWNTHHHPDHTDGNTYLSQKYNCPIYCGEKDLQRIPLAQKGLREGDLLSFATLNWKIWETPGHTLGHIFYYNDDHNILFCGDTLFAMGCGRLFEGTPEQMHQVLSRIKTLPKETLIFCTHEYTMNNSQFAKHIEPNNPAITHRISAELKKRQNNLPTVPFQLEEELKTNPFLRTNSPEVLNSLQSFSGVPSVKAKLTETQAFKYLREWKNVFL